ncbi:MAG: hypothetical protein KGL59_08160 [Acidobacteriota bacterium]|nr:hypothetical protein [Acidobacteriota bacterium]
MRNRLFGTVLLLSGALAISVAPVFAQGRGWGQEKQQEKEAEHRDHGRGHENHGRNHENHGQAFANGQEGGHYRYWRGDDDRQIVVGYYREHPRGLPPGLAKREDLPPGLERQLRVNGHLPPGLEKRVVWFPRDLDDRLPPVPYGYRRCWVGGYVMVVNPKTFAILEIVQGISILAH